MASIQTIKEIKKREPNLNVKYILCSTDSSSLELYKQEIRGDFPINIASKSEVLAKVTQGKFPSFLLRSTSSTRIWSNDSFGALAKDEVESLF